MTASVATIPEYGPGVLPGPGRCCSLGGRLLVSEQDDFGQWFWSFPEATHAVAARWCECNSRDGCHHTWCPAWKEYGT